MHSSVAKEAIFDTFDIILAIFDNCIDYIGYRNVINTTIIDFMAYLRCFKRKLF